MDTLSWTTLCVAFVAGLPLLYRPIATRRLYNRLLKVAASIEREAKARNSWQIRPMVEIRDLALWYAGAMPLIAAGALRRSDDLEKQSPEEIAETEQFFNENGWVLAFMASITAADSIGRFYGTPWNPKLWTRALVWHVVSRMFSRRDGGLVITFEPTKAAKTVSHLETERSRANISQARRGMIFN